MIIEMKNICKSFNHQTNTINDLNLTIHDGELVALLGPSGCGKSTTMLMIAGIYKQNSGDLYFDGQLVNGVEPKDRNIGMVFQSYALYPHMTVLDNIAFPLKQQKVSKEKRYERAKEAAEMVQLGHLLDRKPSQLSGGQQQRVALARAIVKKPKVLLLDEPLSNLDARLKIEMRKEISRIQKELGITTILVTHDQEEAMTMADRIAVMKEGEVIQYSTPMDLYKNPKDFFVAQFIGTPPMNFIQGKLTSTDQKAELTFSKSTLYFDRSLLDISTNQLDVTIGIRPHDLKLGLEGEIRMNGTVQLIEPIGHSQMINVNIGHEQVYFFVEPNMRLNIGQELVLSTNVESLHIFEKTTGKNVRKDLVKELVRN
ncbi:ABC transporter ATP-binding protein [Niallia sp. 01092]|uniref:ABC transporter ATP-binding protein n=1 Tax=unclassified Niallia TaxID=2837522 RepID=UPI003FD50049